MICYLPPWYKNLKNLLLTKELQQQPWFFKQASKFSTQPVGGCQVLWSYPPWLCITWRSVLFVPQKKAHQPQQNKQIGRCEASKWNKNRGNMFFPRDIGPNVSTFPHGSKDPLLLESNPPPLKLSWVCGQVISNLPWSLRWARNRDDPGIHVALHWRLEEGDAKEKNP